MKGRTLGPIQLDRAVGAVVASATGDALGSAYEFGPALSDSTVPAFRTGVFGHAPGEWTDDTSMAMPILLALSRGDSLLNTDVLAGIVARWIEWSTDAKDVGAQTRSVLNAIGAEPSEAAARRAAQAVHQRSGRSGGNGSLMRTGPVALGFLGDGAEAALADAAGRIAQLTHYEQDNVDAVVLWSLAIRHAIRTGEFVPRIGLNHLPLERRGRWRELIGQACAKDGHPRDFRQGNGWVVTAFQAALAAVNGARDVPDALFRAVRGGGDTDTVAAIAGAMAGAVWGAAQVPLVWQRTLHGWPGLRVNDLTRLAVLAARGGRPDRVGWPAGATVSTEYFRHTAAVPHPHDAGVWLGSQSALAALPPSVGAVVSLCRVGRHEVPSGVEAIQVWLVDQPCANANLERTLVDAAAVIAQLRAEGKEVFVHCAEARSRTAAVAALYSVRHRGIAEAQAWRDIKSTLPHFAAGAFQVEAVHRIVTVSVAGRH